MLLLRLFLTFSLLVAYAAADQATCEATPGNFWVAASETCVDCSASGNYFDGTSCVTCTANAYCVLGTRTFCPGSLQAPAGSSDVAACTCPANAAAQQDNTCQCNAGFYGDGTSCTACKTCASDATQDGSCPAGSATDAITCSCNAGFYGTGTSCSACKTCASDATQDTTCPAGSATDTSTCSCNAGLYGDGVTCTACKTCAADATQSGSCPAGSTTDAITCSCNSGYSGSGTTCDSCSIGSYSGAGAPTCTACYTNAITASTGSTSKAACYCDAGTFLTNTSRVYYIDHSSNALRYYDIYQNLCQSVSVPAAFFQSSARFAISTNGQTMYTVLSSGSLKILDVNTQTVTSFSIPYNPTWIQTVPSGNVYYISSSASPLYVKESTNSWTSPRAVSASSTNPSTQINSFVVTRNESIGYVLESYNGRAYIFKHLLNAGAQPVNPPTSTHLSGAFSGGVQNSYSEVAGDQYYIIAFATHIVLDSAERYMYIPQPTWSIARIDLVTGMTRSIKSLSGTHWASITGITMFGSVLYVNWQDSGSKILKYDVAVNDPSPGTGLHTIAANRLQTCTGTSTSNLQYFGEERCALCTACNANGYAATACTTTTDTQCACNAGYFGDGLNCTACATGRFALAGSSACTICPVCSPNAASTGSCDPTANTLECSCNEGYYGNGTTCTICPQYGTCSNGNITCNEGFYISGTTCRPTQATCESWPANFWLNNTSTCLNCSGGNGKTILPFASNTIARYVFDPLNPYVDSTGITGSLTMIVAGVTFANNGPWEGQGAATFNNNGALRMPGRNWGTLSITSGFSISMWLNFNSLITGQGIFQLAQRTTHRLYFSTNGANSFQLYIFDGAAKLNLIFSVGDLTTNKWVHFTIVNQANDYFVYANGVQVGSQNTAYLFPTVTDGLEYFDIGQRSWSSEKLRARVAELRIFNRFLSATEVSQLYSYTGDYIAGNFYFTGSSCAACPANSYCSLGVQSTCPGDLQAPAGAETLSACVCPANSVTLPDDGCQCSLGYRKVLGSGTSYTCVQCDASMLCTNGNWMCAQAYYQSSATTCSACPQDYTSNPGATSISACFVNNGVQVNATLDFVDANYSNFTNALDPSIEILTYQDQVLVYLDNCPAGYYCLADTLSPTACPAGTYRDIPGADELSDCLPCPLGKYCPMATATPSNCPAGTYRDSLGAEGPDQCLACTLGDYCIAGSISPVACPAGTYRATTGGSALSSCTSCPMGYYCPQETITPAACPAGTFNSNLGGISVSSCVACTVGNYCPSATVQPLNCPAGTFRSTTGAATSTDCSICGVGSYCPLGSVTATSCAAGSFRSNTGGQSQDDCSTCTTGNYCPLGAVNPTNCPAGTYQDTTGTASLSQCKQCPVGYYCPQGSSATYACPVGTYRDLLLGDSENSCMICPAGAYCPVGSSNPTFCPAGTYQSLTRKAAVTDCLACPVGHFCPLGTVDPWLCSLGYYRNTTGGVERSSCTACPGGTYCPSAAENPTSCPAGTFRNAPAGSSAADCLDCPPGQYCPQQTVFPVACPAGTYQNATRTTSEAGCIICPAGKYCQVQSSTPWDCSPGTYRGTPGAKDQSECTACPVGNYCPAGSIDPTNCSAGTFRPLVGGMVATDCIACPAGSFCGLAVATPSACAAGSYITETGGTSQSSCTTCPPGSYCILGSIAPTLCGPGTYRNLPGGAHLSDCTLCQPGTYSLSLGRDQPCPLCDTNYYCRTSTTKDSCPVHTTSIAGAYSRINCRCNPGYQCTYFKQIQAIVTLKVTLYEFNNNINNVKTNFLSAMAAAAKVPTSRITINGVITRNRRRNLLAATTKEDVANSARDVTGIDVHATILGAVTLHDLDKQMKLFDKDLHMRHVWAESHRINAKDAPWNQFKTK